MKKTDTFQEDFRAQKADSVLQVLFLAARLGNDWALSELAKAHGNASLAVRSAHTALFPHISFDGTRLTTIAERVGSSKQAVGQLIDDLETMGLVERVPDPVDGRAKLIRYSDEGRKQLVLGVRHLQNLECELGHHIGAHKLRSLHKTLTEVVAFLEARTSVVK